MFVCRPKACIIHICFFWQVNVNMWISIWAACQITIHWMANKTNQSPTPPHLPSCYWCCLSKYNKRHDRLVLLYDTSSRCIMMRGNHSRNTLLSFQQERWQRMPLPSPRRPSSNAAATCRKTWRRSEATTSTRAAISRAWWSRTSPRAFRPAGLGWQFRRSTTWWKNVTCWFLSLKTICFSILVVAFACTPQRDDGDSNFCWSVNYFSGNGSNHHVNTLTPTS